MIYLFLALILLLAIGFCLFYKQKVIKKYELKEKELYYEVKKQIEQNEIQAIKHQAEEDYSAYRESELEKIDLQVQAEKILKIKDLDAFAADVVREWHILKDIVEDAEKEKALQVQQLEELKEQRDQIVKALKREEALRQNREFHSISLDKKDKEDIEVLRDFSGKLHKSILINKLIWSEYFMRPYSEMADRVLGKIKRCGIYKITESATGHAYIGQSSDIRNRWANHLKTALGVEGGAARTRFHDALGDIGIENFTFEMLEECPKDKLNEREKYYINFYQSNDFGWNSTKGNG